MDQATELDVVITTYEMAKSPQLKSLFQRQHFNLLVLDEGHKIKDANAQVSQAVRAIHRENAMILTGTPLQVRTMTSLFGSTAFDVRLTPAPRTTWSSYTRSYRSSIQMCLQRQNLLVLRLICRRIR